MLSSIGLGLLSLAVAAPLGLGFQDRPAPHGQQAEITHASVTLSCEIGRSGRSEKCRVVAESHPGQGFAEAALATVGDAIFSPEGDRPTSGDRARFTIRFAMEDAQPVAPDEPVSIFDLL